MGLKRWANVLADAALRGGKVRLVSCFSRRPEKRRDFMERYGAREADSLEALLSDDEIEAVILTTPNHNHKEHIEALAAAGKHVYCEKPIAHSLEHSWAIAGFAAFFNSARTPDLIATQFLGVWAILLCVISRFWRSEAGASG